MTRGVNLKAIDLSVIATLVRIFVRHDPVKAPDRREICCPHCRGLSVRTRRRGGKDACARLIGLYPWRCPDCSQRFYRLRR